VGDEGSHPEHVFTFSGQPVKDVKNAFAKAEKEANIKNCTLYDLRHTYANNFLRRGGDVVTLLKIQGHTTLQMTMRYVNLVAEDIKKPPPSWTDLALRKTRMTSLK
jgi:integrase